MRWIDSLRICEYLSANQLRFIPKNYIEAFVKISTRIAFKIKRACQRGITALMLGGLAAGAVTVTHAAQRIPQVAETGTIQKKVSISSKTLTKSASTLTAAPTSEVCQSGAKWIRLGFSDLKLKSYDSLTLVSNGGDSYTFEGDNWNGRAFDARALRGDCVEIKPSFASANSSFAVDHYQFGKAALANTPVVVAGAGDICDSTGSACVGTSDLIFNMSPAPDAVFTAGDNAYSNGTLAEFNKNYEPSWGRFKANTHPTPGNHEYNTANATGYFDYFNGVGQQTGPAGDRSKGYYSWDVGDWHFVALNTMSGGTVAAAQLNWLKADLAGTTKPCIAAYWHHPLVSVGNYSPGISQAKPLVDALYGAHADLMLVGHDHNYQRFAKMDGSKAAKSDGIRQVLVGSGGRYFYAIKSTNPLLEVSNADTWGVLKLTLTSTGYTGQFLASAKGDGTKANGKFTDEFSDSCNPKASTSSMNVDKPNVDVKQGASAGNSVTISSPYSFAGTANLSVSGLPAGVTATFDNASIEVPANSSGNAKLTLTADATAPVGEATVTVTSTLGDATRTASFTLNVQAFDGLCGAASGKVLLTAPTVADGLCQQGNASDVSGNGHPWNWSCANPNGGAPAACTATIQRWNVSATAGAGGSVTVANPVVDQGLTTAIQVTPNAGYRIASVSGCGVTQGADTNTYVTAPVTAQCTVSASFERVLAGSRVSIAVNPTKPEAGKPFSIVVSVLNDLASNVQSAVATKAVKLAAVQKAAALPTGNVTVSDNGTTLSSVPLGADGQVSVSIPKGLSEGVHTIVVAYEGDANYAAAQSSFQLTVAAAAPGVAMAVPTLSQWALVLLALLLLPCVWLMRRKQ